MKSPVVPVALRTLKLPALLLREIGRIITVFAAIEHELNTICYSILRLSAAEGRLAVTRQNIMSRMDLLRALLDIHNFEIPADWAAMSKELQHVEEIRDRVAHGVWFIQDGLPSLQITRGNWKPVGYTAKVSRKVVPAGAPIKYETLRGASMTGANHLMALEKFHEGLLAQQEPSPETHQAIHRRLTMIHSRRKRPTGE